MVVGAAVLIPWTAYLAATLPVDYSAHNWDATWVGFDSALVVLLTTTVALALMRRRLVMATAFATGILLICDAWFDVMTAAPADRPEALAAAALLELPVAVLLIQAAWRVFRLDREEPAIFGH
jgi:hypothetical protein